MSQIHSHLPLTTAPETLKKKCICVTGPSGTKRCQRKRACVIEHANESERLDREYESLLDDLTLSWDESDNRERKYKAQRFAKLSICVECRSKGLVPLVRDEILRDREAAMGTKLSSGRGARLQRRQLAQSQAQTQTQTQTQIKVQPRSASQRDHSYAVAATTFDGDHETKSDGEQSSDATSLDGTATFQCSQEHTLPSSGELHISTQNRRTLLTISLDSFDNSQQLTTPTSTSHKYRPSASPIWTPAPAPGRPSATEPEIKPSASQSPTSIVRNESWVASLAPASQLPLTPTPNPATTPTPTQAPVQRVVRRKTYVRPKRHQAGQESEIEPKLEEPQLSRGSFNGRLFCFAITVAACVCALLTYFRNAGAAKREVGT